MNELISNILIGIGLSFSLFGCLGLIRLPDIYNRLQSATKCVTLGTCCIMLSLVVRYGFNDIAIKGLIAIPVLFFTSTAGAHALLKGSHNSGFPMWEKSVVDHYSEDTEGTGEETTEKS
jgi:multicomponent Na+:H+ antiporter subunit G